jgi:hypothetical protein
VELRTHDSSVHVLRLGSGSPTFLHHFQTAPREGCRYGGSIKPISVERQTLMEEQLLKPLPLIQRRLDPKLRGPRQNVSCEGHDAVYVEFFERL